MSKLRFTVAAMLVLSLVLLAGPALADDWSPGVDRPERSVWSPGGAGLWVHGVCGVVAAVPRAFVLEATGNESVSEWVFYLPRSVVHGLTWLTYSIGDIAQGSVAQFVNEGQGWSGYRPFSQGCMP